MNTIWMSPPADSPPQPAEHHGRRGCTADDHGGEDDDGCYERQAVAALQAATLPELGKRV
jgi:hypothetical protein